MAKFKRYDSYKNSGVDWLGEIPSHWEILKLKFVAKQILGGGTPNSLNDFYWTDSQSDGYLWVSIEDISKSEVIQETKKYISKLGLQNCSAKIIKPYSILYSIYASLGKVAYSEKFLTTNQAILSIEIQKKHYYKFMFYYLKTLTQTAINLSNSTTQNNISLLILKNLYCVIPPKDEQEKIASYLDEKIAKIDASISGKEKFIELLKEQKQIIINDAVTKGLNKNAKFKNSGIEWLGEIPSHWEMKKLKFVSNNKNVKSIESDFKVSLENIESQTTKYIATQEITFFEAGINFRKGDVLFGKLRPYLAKVYLAEEDGLCVSEFLVLEAKKIENLFLKYILVSNNYIDYINSSTYGTKMPRANWDFIGNSIIPLPPKDEQEKIVEYIENKISKIDKLLNLEQECIKSLKEYKASLIDSVVTGKVKV
ncbi:MAG: restriction endonuclease subunit S [Campylobacter sp.]